LIVKRGRSSAPSTSSNREMDAFKEESTASQIGGKHDLYLFL
jgi:hypothetical protein